MTTKKKTDPEAIKEIESRILAAFTAGTERISVLTVMGEVRADLKLPCNNCDAPTIADSLIARYPDLDPVIERRARGNKSKHATQDVAPAHPDLAFLSGMIGRQVQIDSITVTAGGHTRTISLASLRAKRAA